MTEIKADKVIIGAGLYGLYAALSSAKRGECVVVLEKDKTPLSRATYVNQARVHQGYHYPRSLSTAMKSAHYFTRFNEDYSFCINRSFSKVYATSACNSWTNADEFMHFCRAANIPCTEIAPSRYFKDGMASGAFLCQEYTYDAGKLRDYFVSSLKQYPKVSLLLECEAVKIEKKDSVWRVFANGIGEKAGYNVSFSAPYVLNATYASANQTLHLLGDEYEPFRIKYELCEIILCDAKGELSNCGITVMDGPFFSIMPFGLTGQHSLTAVSFTPHDTCHEVLPSFSCMEKSKGFCSPQHLANCSSCPVKPETAYPYMSSLAHKYLRTY